MGRVSDRKAREAAFEEGLLDPVSRELPFSRWPRWAVTRYCGDDPRPGPDEVAEPITVDEVR